VFVFQLSKNNAVHGLRECGVEFARVTTDQIEAIANIYLESLASSEVIGELARSSLLEYAQYDVTVAKVCGSCEDIIDASARISEAALNSQEEFGFGTLCAENAYGYSAQHSALVFAPLEPGTDQIMTGYIRGILSVRVLLL
jgi:hypothetical protein